MIKKIISGAQTGADRAGLEAALALKLEVGGTVPKGRKTDAGPLSDYEMMTYNLREHKSDRYSGRTKSNVKDSDGTVIFGDTRSSGSALTIKYCTELGKPFVCNPDVFHLQYWVKQNNIQVLNVAGNRERTNPGIFRKVHEVLTKALR